ncbi:MAG: tetratricopeptide repeat protein, partial [Acidimicrobiales bacterium]
IAELTAGLGGDGGHARRALQIEGSGLSDPWLRARALNRLGIRAYFVGAWADAVEYYGDSRAACEEAGDRWTAAVESSNIAEVLSDQGHFAAARPMLQEALEVYEAAGTPTFVAGTTRHLGRLEARGGNLNVAQERLRAARGIYQSDGEALQVALTDAYLAEAALLCGDVAAALDGAEAVLSRMGDLPGSHLVRPLAGRVLGVALAAAGKDPDRSVGSLRTSADSARAREALYEMAMSLQALAELWPAHIGPGEPWEAERTFERLGVLEPARRLWPRDLPEVRVAEVADL